VSQAALLLLVFGSVVGRLFFGLIGVGSRRKFWGNAAAMATRTAPNIKLVIAGKGSPAIMTLQTIVTGRCSVFEDLDVCDLSRIWSPGNNVVAFIAANTIVIAVSEDRFEIVFGSRRSVIRTELMAHAALAKLALCCVASITGRVRLKTERDRFSRPGRIVTSGASLRGTRGAAFMHRVVKPHVESLNKLRRECFDRRILSFRVGVADHAHRLVFINKLI